MIRNITLKDAEMYGLAFVGPVLQIPRQGRRVLESGFYEESADLNVGIDPCLDSPEELKDESVPVNDLDFALLGSRHSRLKVFTFAAPDLPERLGMHSDHLAPSATQTLPLCNGIQKGVSKGWLP